MEKNKSLWIGIIIVLVIVIVFWFVNKSSAPTVYNNTSDTNNTNALSVDSTEDLGPGSVNTGASAATISYTNALIKYKDARLQLDKICQASPDKMTFKNNAFLMVDNRAPVARNVKVGTTFPLKAYGFKIVELHSATLPATWQVDCDKSQNVSTILIEK